MSDGGPYVGDSMENVVDFPAELDGEIIVRMLRRVGIENFVLIVDGREHVITDLEDGKDILWHLRTTEFKLMRIADGTLVRDSDGTAA